MIIKRLLGIEKLSKIKVPIEFQEHPPKKDKMIARKMYYKATGKYAVPIVITDRGYLLDGYTTYLIAKESHKKYVKINRV